MAASMTITYDEGVDLSGNNGSIKKILVDWVSASDGTASGTTRKIVGTLIKGVTNPGAVAPTDNYDIAITDEESADVLASCEATHKLGDRDTANTEASYFMIDGGASGAQANQPVVCDALTISITNAGDTKAGRLILYYRPR